jgi:glucoamylase
MKPGVVVASPSKADPDYFFNWVRDSALVFKCIIDQYAGLEGNDPALRTLIDNFVSAEATYQHVPNPSGDVDTGGLGEPKFQVNLKAFEGDWGRPQRGTRLFPVTALHERPLTRE